jgi:hypothetical protein
VFARCSLLNTKWLLQRQTQQYNQKFHEATAASARDTWDFKTTAAVCMFNEWLTLGVVTTALFDCPAAR